MTDANYRYRYGFEGGERAAFEDRRAPQRRSPPHWLTGAGLRGWIAGYTPRNPAWRQLPPRPTMQVGM